MTAYRGSNPYLSKRWNPELRLFVPDEVSLSYPVEGWGYEEVGKVDAIGPDVSAVAEGDVVCGAWGHRSSHLLAAEYAARNVLEPGVGAVNGVCSRR